MTLHAWIEKTGPKKVAKLLKVNESTVSRWRSYQSLPRPNKLMKIKTLSKNKIKTADVVATFTKRQASK